MHNRSTDAELVSFLKLMEKHRGSASAAATAAGKSEGQGRALAREAKARGLTAQTVIRDPLAKLQIENADLRRRVKESEHEQETAAAIREQIWKIEAHDPSPPKWTFGTGRDGFRGMPMLLASDWHYGEVVRPEEIGGLNKFNSEIASTRIRRFTETAIDLAFNHMGKAKTKYPGIFLLYGGDMISGSIHEELAITNDRTPIQCVNDLTDLMGTQVETLATKFGKIWVPCVTGNHGRNTKRMYAKGRVFHSYEWNIYCNLARSFKGNKNVHFSIPEETDCRFNVYGHRYLLTHGDTLGVKGGDGIIGALGPIRRGEIKIRNAESQIDRDFDTLVMGHWHQYIPLPGLTVNNALKGYDEYARSILRAPFSRPSQAMWFTHPEHGVTAHWQIYLEGQQHTKKPTVEFWK
jgi:hypothetical protein